MFTDRILKNKKKFENSFIDKIYVQKTYFFKRYFFQSAIPPSPIDLELFQKLFLVVLLGAYQPVFFEGGF